MQTDSVVQNTKNRIIGTWVSYQKDEARKSGEVDTVTITFTESGQLLYKIDSRDSKKWTMKMMYKISGDTIISNGASQGNEQKILFKIEKENKLLIQFNGEKAVFIKTAKQSD